MTELLPVSIVVPVLNEAITIHELLDKLRQQTMRPAEIIFCDAGSTDGTPNLIQEWWQKHGTPVIKLTIIKLPGAMPGGGRNMGVRTSSNPWIAFIDAGITPNIDWLEQLWRHAESLKAKAVFGTCQFYAEGIVQRAACALSYGVGASHSVVPASLFAREVFENAGYFREDLRAAEDLLWMQVIDAHYPRMNCEKALVTYTHFPATQCAIAKKWYVIQLHTVYANTRKLQQYVYISAPFILFGIWMINHSLALWILLAYITLRGVIDPCKRSKSIFWWKGEPMAFFMAVPTAIIIDTCKLSANLVAYIRLSFKRN